MILRIAENFSFPIELVTSTQAILARKRSGKSYTASVEAEEMLEHDQQIAVIDPTSAWYGLRSSADGEGPGYSVVVFGGDHADAPLDFRSGKQMAQAIVDHGFSAIFDIGGWITEEQIKFVFDFTAELLRINRAALHLFIDEADTFAPQMLESKEQKKCLGAMSRLVKQGGIKGIGVTMITQRSADINKKLLSQIDILTLLRMSAPDDIIPPIKWIAANVSPAYAAEVEQALPRLGIGKAYVCSNLTGSGTYVEIRERRTFNSGATPKPGERKVEPKVLAPIDIQKLGAQIADSIKENLANSPEALKEKVADLQRKLATGSEQISKEREQMLVQQIEAMEEELEQLRGFRDGVEQRCGEIAGELRRLLARLESLAPVNAVQRDTAEPHVPLPSSRCQLDDDLSAIGDTIRLARKGILSTANPATLKSDSVLDGPSMRVLTALADLEAVRVSPAPREQVGVFAGYSNLNSKGLVNALGALRSAGHIDYPESGKVALTESGRKLAPSITTPKTNADFHARLMQMMGGPESRLLQVLIARRRHSIDREELASLARYTNLNSKGFVNSLGRLRTLGLLDYPRSGQVQATALLFLEGRA